MRSCVSRKVKDTKVVVIKYKKHVFKTIDNLEPAKKAMACTYDDDEVAVVDVYTYSGG